MYGNTQQTLIRLANHHPSPSSRQAEQVVPTNGIKGSERFAPSLSGQSKGRKQEAKFPQAFLHPTKFWKDFVTTEPQNTPWFFLLTIVLYWMCQSMDAFG